MSITERADERTDSSGPVGAQLRGARIAQGLSIEDVCQRTNIRPTVVHALENGDLEPSGGAVYARGHVRTLAQALDLNSDALLANFDASYGARMPRMPVLIAEPEAPAAPSPRAPRDPGSRPATAAIRGPRWSWVFAVVLVAVIVIALVQLVLPEGSSSGKPPRSSVPSAAAKPAAKPKHTAPSLLFPVPAEGVTLRIVLATKPSWLEISDERGVKLIARVVQPSSQPVDLHAAGGLNATFGDASAVTLSCNGRPLGPIGAPNQVVTLILTRGSAQCPAA